MLLKICKFESTEDVISTLPTGSHVLGRGDILQCNDKRISRKHALIEVNEDAATITSIHINPCFFMASDSKTVTIIPKDSSQNLNNGDKFALLPDSVWFKVKFDCEGEITINNEPGTSNGTTNDSPIKEDSKDNEALSPSVKRSLDEENEAEEAKRCKLLNNVRIAEEMEITEINATTSNNTLDVSNSDEGSVAQIKTEPTDPPESEQIEPANPPEPIATNSNNATNVNVPEIKKEDIKLEDQNNAEVSSSTSPQPTTSNTDGTQNRRDRCWYGSTCYRKNPTHLQQFSHPADDDYNSVDTRPVCSFGAACYRKSSEHRRNYSHPPQTGTNNQQKKEKRKRKAAKKPVDKNETPEDDYDYEDPFIDDSGDEYEQDESDDSDSEWMDSQEVEEDSQETNCLLREAKRFTKK